MVILATIVGSILECKEQFSKLLRLISNSPYTAADHRANGINLNVFQLTNLN